MEKYRSGERTRLELKMTNIHPLQFSVRALQLRGLSSLNYTLLLFFYHTVYLKASANEIFSSSLRRISGIQCKMLRDRLFAIAFFWNTNSQAEQISLAVVSKDSDRKKSIAQHFTLNAGNPPLRLNSIPISFKSYSVSTMSDKFV